MEKKRLTNWLIASLLLSIALMALAGVWSWRISDEADTLAHRLDHVEVNRDLLKAFLAQKQKEKR